MPEFYTLVILLINQLGEIGEKQLSVFGSRGGQNLPLNARTPLSRDMRLPTMLYERPAKAHTRSLIRAFFSRLNIL